MCQRKNGGHWISTYIKKTNKTKQVRGQFQITSYDSLVN